MADRITTSNGNPVTDNSNSLTVGDSGTMFGLGAQILLAFTLHSLLQDFHLIDKLAHFDRERIPERCERAFPLRIHYHNNGSVVHAKGAGAHGYFEVTKDISQCASDTKQSPVALSSAVCKAKFLSAVGKRTPVFTRFSTVGGATHPHLFDEHHNKQARRAAPTRHATHVALPSSSTRRKASCAPATPLFQPAAGNWDMVGNNTPVFFIRDPSQFPGL